MIQIKRVRFVPGRVVSALNQNSKEEWLKLRPYRNDLYSRAKKMYVVSIDGKPMLFVGFIPGTWLGTGTEIVMLVCEDMKKHSISILRFMRKALRRVLRVFKKLSAAVDTTFTPGHPFMKLLGFDLICENSTIYDGSHSYYEMRVH